MTSLKWELTGDRRFDIGAGSEGKQAMEVVSDFAGYLRGILHDNRVDPENHDIAVTVPVGYPLSARRGLLEAFRNGGLPIKSVYPEPVAALYAVLASNRRDGYSAIFDWGGGTLDIAMLQVIRGTVHVLSTEGMKEGGDDFDEWIAKDALKDFLSIHPVMERDREKIWQNKRQGLLLRAERAKCDYINYPKLSWIPFLGDRDLECLVDAASFEDRVAGSVEKGINLFRRAIRKGGGSERLLKPIILSGGTRNLTFLRHQLEAEFGDTIVDNLPETGYFQDLIADRIDSATAIGAALLMANESRPVFSKSLGIRLADARSSAHSDLFCEIFKKGEPVDHSQPIPMDFHVTNPSSG